MPGKKTLSVKKKIISVSLILFKASRKLSQGNPLLIQVEINKIKILDQK